MSAPDEHTFAEKEELEEMDEGDEDMQEEEEEEKKVYVPGIEPLRPGEELEMDRSAYRMYHECQTGKKKWKSTVWHRMKRAGLIYYCCCLPSGAPCLSFDVLKDGDGDGRQQFPLSMLLCAGTQADTAMGNRYRPAYTTTDLGAHAQKHLILSSK